MVYGGYGGYPPEGGYQGHHGGGGGGPENGYQRSFLDPPTDFTNMETTTTEASTFIPIQMLTRN